MFQLNRNTWQVTRSQAGDLIIIFFFFYRFGLIFNMKFLSLIGIFLY